MPEILLSQIDSFEHNVRELDDADEWLPCLADDIAKNGLLHPITVRPVADAPERYEVIAGQRRVAACKLLNMPSVNAVVVQADDSDSFLISLSENMHRKPMSNKEKCAALARCYEECEHNISKVCALTHLAASTVRRFVNIATLPEEEINRLDSKGDDRLTLAAANDMAKSQAETTANDGADTSSAADAGSVVEEAPERPPRKRSIKADPWVYDADGNAKAIPESLFPSVNAMIDRAADA